MRAICIAVGSELLEKNRLDTNSLYIGRKLLECGILMDMKTVVGDDMDNLTWMVKNACKRSQLVIVTGGLGPTEDDITREAVANALKRELNFQEEIVEDIRERFKKRGIDMPEINTRQGFVIEGAELLPNPVGTAPGQYIDDEKCRVLLLPGPPSEMNPMFDKILTDRIACLCNFHVYKRSFKFAGITESEADSMIAEIYAKHKNPRTTILAAPGLIEVHLLGRSRKSPEEAQEPTDMVADKIKDRLKDYLVTERDISLEQYIVEELGKKGLTLSVAESCTGGRLGNIITDVPGSSEVFVGGVIAYSNTMKMDMLGVDNNLLTKHGAVSKEAAAQMAKGVRELTASDIGVAITGIAGPGGAVRGKPVGLVFMHLHAADDSFGIYQVFPGDRNVVKTRTVNYTLNLIKQYLQKK